MASTNFINECKNRANANRLGQLIIDGIDNPITQSDRLQSFTIDSGCYVDGNIIGSVYVKKLTGKILDSADVSLVDKTIQAKLGVKYADNSIEYLNIGKYTVERPNVEKTANMSEFTAYNDLINKLDDKYVCNIDYSKGNITLVDLYNDVCSQISLTPATTTFDNSSISVSANPFTNGEKNRTVLQVIAKVTGSWIEIDDDSNQIDLHWLSQNSEPDYIFNLNDYSSVEGGEITCGPINCLIIKNSQVDDENITITDDESIALYGENSIVINEDYILYNSDLRQQAINAIWNKVHGLNYVDCKLITYYGKPFLKLGDKIRIYTSETECFDTYVLKHNFTYDGTFTSVIESPVLTKQEVKNKQNISLGELLRNVRIDVNKQEQKINLAVETAQEAYDKVEVYNPVLESTGNGQLSLPDCAGEDLLEFTVDGKSEQETSTTGKNILDLERFAEIGSSSNYYSYDKTTNVLTSSANDTRGWASNDSLKIKVSPNTTYYIRWDGNVRIQYGLYKSDGTYINAYYITNTTTFTTTSDTAFIRIKILSQIGGTYPVTASNIMICLNSIADKSYEAFIPNSPSPDYPSEIKSISGVENLLDTSDWQNAYIDSSGNIKASNVNATFNKYTQLTPNKTYTLSANRIMITLNVAFYNNETFISNIEINNKSQNTFTVPSNANNIRTHINYDNSTAITKDVIDILELQIVKGTERKISVPYGSNYLVEKVVGKNLANIPDFNCGDTGGSTYRRNIDVIPNKEYTLSLIKSRISGTTIRNNNIYDIGIIAFQNGEETINQITGNVVSLPSGSINISKTFTTPENCNKILIDFKNRNGDGNVNTLVSKVQLEEGSQVTEYEEYKEVVSLIDLKGNKLCSNKDLAVKDLLTVKNGKVTIDKKVKEVIFDGSEDWAMGTSNGINFFVNQNQISDFNFVDINTCNYMCDYFKAIKVLERWLDNTFYISGGKQATISSNNFSTVDELKTWLSQNQVTVKYELATPQTIDLGEVSIQTVQSDCTLELEEELDTDMYAKYIKNNPYNEAYSTRLSTKAQIQLSENKIESSVSETILQNTELMQGEIDSLSSNLANNYMTSEEVQNLNNLTNESLAVITNEFKQVQTSTQTQFQAITNILQNGVNLVKTTYTTIDDEGIKIAKSTDSFNSTFDNRGLKLYSYTDLMAVYTNKGAGVSNLLVTGTMDLGYSKIMKVTLNGKKYTGIFYSDAMAQTLEDFVED